MGLITSMSQNTDLGIGLIWGFHHGLFLGTALAFSLSDGLQGSPYVHLVLWVALACPPSLSPLPLRLAFSSSDGL